MNILRECNDNGFNLKNVTPTITCKVFEDNSGALEMATTHKFRPRTKHINVKLHHFLDYVVRGDIIIKAISTTNQLADFLTKPVSEDTLRRLRKIVLGW